MGCIVNKSKSKLRSLGFCVLDAFYRDKVAAKFPSSLRYIEKQTEPRLQDICQFPRGGSLVGVSSSLEQKYRQDSLVRFYLRCLFHFSR